MNQTFVRLRGTALISLLLCAGLLSCKMSEEREEAEAPAQVTPSRQVFYATTEGADTKVYTDANLHVLWNKDDLVTIFQKTTLNEQFKFRGNDGDNSGYFDLVPQGFGTGNSLDFNYSVYPYNGNTAYHFGSPDYIQTDFPRVQTYRANSFGPNSNLMIAKSATANLSFKNVGGYLCLKLYGEGYSVRSIVLTGNNGETLSGPVKITLDGNNIPSLEFDTTNPEALSKELVLTTPSPVALGASAAEAVTFWMVVPPITFSGGFTVRVIDSQGGTHVQSTSKNIEIERSTQYQMAAFVLTGDVLAPYTASEMGVYPVSGSGFAFNKETDQVNLYEAEGKVWARFLRIPTLTMYEIGPIPAGVTAGTTFSSSVKTYVDGAVTESLEGSFTVQSLAGGMLNLVSDEGSRYAIRF